ncbi:MAG: hypothetical protein AAGK23_05560 [Pseudomonadota bacterium]
MRILIFLFALMAPIAQAQDVSAKMAYADGRFIEAADIAETVGDADNLAFAARSLLAASVATDDEPDPALIQRANTLATQALQQDDLHIEGRIQLAISLSLTARPMSTRDALRSGHGETARDLAKAVLEDDPDNSYAHGFLSVWNVEVLRRGGRIGAAVLGASVKKGRAHYQAAIAAQPDEASLHWQWARVLTALNARKYRDEIQMALSAALAASTETAIETVMQERARKIETAIATQSREVVEGLAARML